MNDELHELAAEMCQIAASQIGTFEWVSYLYASRAPQPLDLIARDVDASKPALLLAESAFRVARGMDYDYDFWNGCPKIWHYYAEAEAMLRTGWTPAP